MTTKNSPHAALKAQADRIADTLKRAERGEKIDARFAEKIDAARRNKSFNAGIVMDDKVITIDIPWEAIREATAAELSEFIIAQMRRSPE